MDSTRCNSPGGLPRGLALGFICALALLLCTSAAPLIYDYQIYWSTALGGVSLDDNPDVDTAGKSSGDLLKWDGANWVDASPASMGLTNYWQRSGTELSPATAGDNLKLDDGTDKILLINGAIDLYPAGIGDVILAGRVYGDANVRFGITAAGYFVWGDGAGATDIDLQRAAANHLQLGAGDVLQLVGGGGDWGGTAADGMIYYDTAADLFRGRANGSWVTLNGSGGGYDTIQEDGTGLTQRTTLDFVGSAFTASDTGSKTQVDGDSDLDALASNSTNGFWVRTGAGTGAARTMTAGNGMTVLNGDGVSSNPTFAMAGNLPLNLITITGNQTLTTAHCVQIVTLSGATTCTITLPAVANTGYALFFRRTDLDFTSTCTIDPAGTEQWEGTASGTGSLGVGGVMTIVSDGTSWWLLNQS